MGFVGCIPRFLKAHAGWVLTALGSAGLVGTVILATREAPVALKKIEHAAAKDHEEWMCENVYPEESLDPEDFDREMAENLKNAGEWPGLTFWEKTKIALPVYIPSILLGTGTLACFWGAQIFNAKKQAALVAAYGALTMQFNQYREAIKAEYGEEADKKAYEVSQMEVRRLRKEIEKIKEENGPFRYEFATLPGVIFETTPKQISSAFMHFNRNMMMRGHGNLAELYMMTGLPESAYDVKDAFEYGWTEYENEANFGFAYTDFDIQQVKNRHGRDVRVINPVVPPFELEVDYGFEGNVEEHLYSGYNPDMARAFAEEIGEDETIKVDSDWECYIPGLC